MTDNAAVVSLIGLAVALGAFILCVVVLMCRR